MDLLGPRNTRITATKIQANAASLLPEVRIPKEDKVKLKSRSRYVGERIAMRLPSTKIVSP